MYFELSITKTKPVVKICHSTWIGNSISCHFPQALRRHLEGYLRLTREGLPLIWSIDRSEVIEAVYVLEDGALALRPEHFEATG